MDALLELNGTGDIETTEDPSETQVHGARKICHSELILVLPTQEIATTMAPSLMKFIESEKRITVVVHMMGPVLHIFFPDQQRQAVWFICGQIKGPGKMFILYNYGHRSNELLEKWKNVWRNNKLP